MSVATAPIWTVAPRDKRGPGQRGAPKKNESDVVALFWQRVSEGSASRKSCAQEARDIAAIENHIFGETARATKSIENRIRADYRRWEDSGFKMTGPETNSAE